MVVRQASETYSPLVSIVIPARNEAEDMAATLDACLAIEYAGKEIIVVDDSTDETPQIVARYAEQGVRLIHRDENRNGCCGARNLGMQLAHGEIVVLMNADNRPQPDFLRQILVHYQAGADYVIVKSTVVLRSDPWSRFAFASGLLALQETDPEWSEGFSCRRAAAEAVGYIPGDFPVPFCRDWMFGQAMGQHGFTKHVDLDIPMEHVVPGTFSSYWGNRVWRGTFSAPHAFYFRGMSLGKIVAREGLKLIRTALKYLLIVPVTWQTVRLVEYSSNGWRDLPGLCLGTVVQDVGISLGNLRGLGKLLAAEGTGSHAAFWGRASQG